MSAQGKPPGAAAGKPSLSGNRAELLRLLKQKREKINPQLNSEITRLPDTDDPVPASFAQQRLWFIDQLEGGSAHYNTPAVIEVSGHFNNQAAEYALQQLIERHEPLRTVFRSADGKVEQIISRDQQFTLTQIDLSEFSEAVRLEKLEALIHQDAVTPFDLSAELLLRASFIHLQSDSGVLLFNIHHIACDGWSMSIVVQEFVAIYEAFVGDRHHDLEPLAIRYRDYANWQRRTVDKQTIEKQLAHWRKAMAGAPEQHSVFTDKPRPEKQTFKGANHTVVLNKTISAGLNALSLSHRATLFMVLHGAFAAFLARIGDDNDIVIGTPVANRLTKVLQPLVGFFVNTLPLRTQIDLEQTFEKCLKQIVKINLEAQANQDVPFDMIVEHLNPRRSSAYSPLFQITFRMDNNEAVNLDLSDVSLRVRKQVQMTNKFDLTLSATEILGEIELDFEYATDLFEHTKIEQMATHFVRFVEGLLSAPQLRLCDIPMLSQRDTDYQLHSLNQSDLMSVPELMFHQLFEHQVMKTPGKVALTYGQQSISYDSLNRQANRLARRIQQEGVKSGDFVGIFAHRSPLMFTSILAVLKNGAVFVPLDANYPQERLQHMVDATDMKLILADDTASFSRVINNESIPLVPMASETGSLAEENLSVAMRQPGEQLAYVVFTSGSTGQPKGVMISHASLVNLALAQQKGLSIDDDAYYLQFYSMSFDAGLEGMASILTAGARIHIVDQADLDDTATITDIIQSRQITHLHMPPAVMSLLDPASLPSVRHVEVGGELYPKQLIDLWSRYCRFINVYGPTETTISSSVKTCRWDDEFITIGKPLANYQYYVFDEQMRLCPLGTPGELYIGGVGVGTGYLGRPDLTRQRFVANPYSENPKDILYRTGDKVRYHQNGELIILGRLDDQVKVRGFRIETGEIEQQLCALEAVSGAVVIAREDEGHKQLVAYLTLSQPQQDIVTLARQALSAALPDYMVPAAFVVLDQLPLTANGKIDKKALPAPVVDTTGQDYQAPTNDTEQAVQTIWASLLNRTPEQVSIDANFFELGGDSILSIQVVSRLNEMGYQASMKQLFEYQSIRALAPHIQLHQGEQHTQQVNGDMLLLPIQLSFLANRQGVHHFNQAALFYLSDQVTPDGLSAIVTQLYLRHDALRLHLDLDADIPRASFADFDDDMVDHSVSHVQLPSLEAIEDFADTIQASLNISTGPLMRAVHITTDDQHTRLLMVIHHLVVDGISWRILAQDIQQAIGQLRQQQPVVLAGKTASYQQWGQLLRDYAQHPTLLAQQDYWHQVVATPSRLWGPTHDLPHTAKRDALEFSLSAQDTQHLLQDAPGAYRTQVNELLLSALALAIHRSGGPDTLRIDLEGHGRESLHQECDISQTVGWFTSLFPVTLQGAGHDLESLICHHKESLRAVPQHGIGFGILQAFSDDPVLRQASAAELLFNYLGQFDQSMGQDHALTLANESTGQAISPARPLSHPLVIDSMVHLGQLKVIVQFACEHPVATQVQALTTHFQHTLIEVIQHCCQPQVGKPTPADFPLASISQHELDQWHRQQTIDNLYPATTMQQGLLFHSAMDRSAYVTQLLLHFDSGVDGHSMQQAWQQLLNRHDIFRTRFVANQHGDMQQLVMQQATLPWHQQDLAHLTEQEARQQIARYREKDKQTGFTLDQAPLMRVALWSMPDGKTALLWTHHHALCDGWSLPLVFTQLAELYRAIKQQTKPDLPNVIPYQHYVQWLTEYDKQAAIDFWTDNLADLDGPTSLPVCKPQVTGSTGTQTFTLTLDEQHTRALQAFAKQQHTTLNILMQAAWAYLLAYYTGDENVVFGSTHAGRPATLNGVENMVGLFINTLPVHLKVDHSMTVSTWIHHLHQAQLQRAEHAYLPLPDIQKQACGHIQGPLFDSLLVFENYPIAENFFSDVDQAGLRLIDSQGFEETNFPLTLTIAVQGQIKIEFGYDNARFPCHVIKDMAQCLSNALIDMLREPQQPLKSLALLDEQMLNTLVRDFNHTDAPLSLQPNIMVWIHQQVLATPDATALRFEDNSVSYRTMWQQVTSLSTWLNQQQLTDKALIGIHFDRGVEMVTSLLAVVHAGYGYLPIETNMPAERLDYILNNSAIDVLLTDTLLHIVDSIEQVRITPDFIAKLGAASEQHKICKAAPNDLAYMIYTSGSTGQPKGVLLEHGGLLNRIQWMQKAYPIGPNDKILQKTPYTFDVSVWEFFWPLVTGASLVIAKPGAHKDPVYIARLIQHNQISVLHFVPSMFSAMINSGHWSGCGSVRHIICSGEVLPADTVAKHLNQHNGALHNLYGPTEACIDVSYWDCQADSSEQAIPIGFPIDNTQLYVMNRHQQLLPPGIEGELYIGGVNLARGYHDNAELTAEKFVNLVLADELETRLYRTGDVVYQTQQGVLYYQGRRDHQVKIRGLRVELGEIETQLLTHDEVQQAVVIAVGQGTQMRLVAFVVAKGDLISSRQKVELRRFLAELLPEHMIPAQFHGLAEIPLNRNGKVDRYALLALAQKSAGEQPAQANELCKFIAKVWQRVLGHDQFSITDNFFEVGGNSLSSMQLQAQLQQELATDIALTDLFEYPSISAFANSLDRQTNFTSAPLAATQDEIAIVGYAGRFPDADSVEAFWHNIANGVESLRIFSDDELRQTGTPQALLENPHFVKKGVLLDDIDKFDAGFFGFTPREAELIDPQQRLLFECAQQALELAGYGDRSGPRQVGVFCGVMDSHYLTEHIMPTQQTQGRIDPTVMHANSSAYSATRLAYKLNLQGPSINVVTACSTSLVAVHQACVSLQRGECQMALAGGAAVNNLQPSGYLYQEGGIASPDGHCRTFDQQARGTRGGDGAGLVLLKPLSQAIQDGDTIHAVIKGSAVNNDGADKVGYTAPSVAGQTDVIRRAQHAAGVTPESIQYVEAHGTGTRLGDPIEIKALNNAFGAAQTPYCAIGSVKTNIGHLDAAAGIAGLLKTVQALKHKQLPPSLNFSQPNPNIPFEGSAFYVNTALKPWPETDTPRRAAVSSFGIGGTNAHVVLEQAPAVPSGEIVPGHHPLLLSARSRDALEQQVQQLQQHLQDNPSLALQDVAFTLQAGRTPLPYRLALTADSIEQAQQALAQATLTDNPVSAPEHIVMLFPGQGSQYLAMAHSLYEQPGLFRDTLAHCAEILTPLLECDLIDLLYHNDDPQQLLQTRFAQPALFAIEYSLAKQLIDLGLKPDIMIGHSLGEYVAACLAGVFSLEQALTLIVARANLMQQANPGSMLAVACERDTLEPYLQRCNCDLAAVNGPQSCVAAGTEQDIETLAQLLSKQDIPAQTLRTSHAFHSRMMAPVLEPLAKVLANINLQAPNIPYLSNLTGQMITDQQATSVDYWLQHLRHTVAFHDGLRTLAAIPELDVSRTLMIEVGPGQTLLALARKQPALLDACKLDTLGRQPSPDGAQQIFTQCLANAWAIGCRINWHKLHRRHSRVPLPTYPFQRQRYWLDKPAQQMPAEQPAANNHLTYTQWQMTPPVYADNKQARNNVLILSDNSGIAEGLAEYLKEHGHKAYLLFLDEAADQQDDKIFYCDGESLSNPADILAKLSIKQRQVNTLINAWSLDGEKALSNAHLKFVDLLLTEMTENADQKTDISADYLWLTHDAVSVAFENQLNGQQALIYQTLANLTGDKQNIRYLHIDLGFDCVGTGDATLIAQYAKQIFAECNSKDRQLTRVLRGKRRWLCQTKTVTSWDNAGSTDNAFEQIIVTSGIEESDLLTLFALKQVYPAATMHVLFDVGNSAVKKLAYSGFSVLTRNAIKQLNSAFPSDPSFTFAEGDLTDAAIINAYLSDLSLTQDVPTLMVLGSPLTHLSYTGIDTLSDTVQQRARFYNELDFNFFRFSKLSWLLVDTTASNSKGLTSAELLKGVIINEDANGSAVYQLEIRSPELNQPILEHHDVKAVCTVAVKTALARPFEQVSLALENIATLSTGSANQAINLYSRNSKLADLDTPENDTESALLRIWQSLLGVEDISVKENFFELGGDSLLVTRLLNSVKETFSLPDGLLSVETIFRQPEIRTLAKCIDDALNQCDRHTESAFETEESMDEGVF